MHVYIYIYICIWRSYYDPSTRPQTAGYWHYLGFGIIVKESWSRSHGRGIIEEHHGIDIMGKESWERNHGKRHHGRGIMGEESWKEESWKEESWEEAPKRLPGGSPEAPRRFPETPRRFPGGSQEAVRATRAPRGPWEGVGSFCIKFYYLFCKSYI